MNKNSGRITVRRNRFQFLLSDAERAEIDRRAALAQADRSAVIRAAVFGSTADVPEAERQPDSRDPEPPRSALKRIVREAHRIGGRANDERDGSDIEALATLVAELADVLKETIEER